MRNAIAKIEDGCPPWAEGLTDRERRFVEEYLVDLSAGAAAQRAGLGKKKASSSQIASRMRRKQNVAEAIHKLLAERSGATGTRIIEEFSNMALVNVTDYVQVKEGKLVVVDTDKLTEDQRRGIVGIKETINEKGHRTIEYKFEKLAACDKLARVLSLYKDRAEISTPYQPVDMSDAHERLEEMICGVRARLEANGAVLSYDLDPPVKRISAVAPVPVRIIEAD